MSRAMGVPMNYPALLGVYLAVNALEDAFVLVDGPDCAFYKAHFIHGRHDLRSTLLRMDGRHRVGFTNVCSRGVVKDHDDIIARETARLVALPQCAAVLLTALPMCSITGVDYGRVIRSRVAGAGKTVAEIPPESLCGDWLDGYEQALAALAKAVPFAPGMTRRGGVAIVGHLMDRNEADHLANLAELRRMTRALGLEPVSLWPGGEGVAALARAEEAEWVVSLPYARLAARRVAQRTGARLIEAELPFGLRGTEAFLRALAGATGREAQAAEFLDAELSRVAPRLNWIVPQLFLHRRLGFIGDPRLLPGMRALAEDLGMDFAGAIIRGRAAHLPGGVQPGVLCEPSAGGDEVRRFLEQPMDLLVASRGGDEGLASGRPVLEFGFPSYRHHALFERPFLGFPGVLAMVERMAEELNRAQEAAAR